MWRGGSTGAVMRAWAAAMAVAAMPGLAPAQVSDATSRGAPEGLRSNRTSAVAAEPVPLPSPAASLGEGDVLDVHRIDPEAFQALAVRLPPGRAPRIDGRLDDAVWSLAPAQGHFIQREPRFGMRSTERTEFRILYDDRRLYFGIWAFDSDARGIRASELKRDAGLRKGDQIKIVIDTFHDHRNAFYFSTNPLGAYKDAQSVENGRTINYDWNAVWQNETSVDEHGWYAEIAIPLSQLRFHGTPGDQVWGLNVCRIIIRKNEETYWVPYPREWSSVGFSRMSHAGVLLGLRGLEPRRRLELVPFAIPSAAHDRTAPEGGGIDVGFGADARVGLTTNLVADLTWRTDFAQVEADQEVVNLSRFSLFFPEKRQFFTESAGLFDFGRVGTNLSGGDSGGQAGLLQLFYTRRIGLEDGRRVPILGGGKLTGRAGPYTIGALNITTDALEHTDGTGRVQVPRANYTAVRIKRDFLAQSSVGVILLDREGGRTSAWNRTIGFDSGLVLGESLHVTGLFARTFSPGAAGRDAAGALDVGWKTDRYNAGATYLDIGERFNAEMGFVPRTGIRNLRSKAGWTPRPRWRGVRQLSLGSEVDYFEDHAGRPESRTHTAEGTLSFQDSANLRVVAERSFDRLPAAFALGPITFAEGGYDWTRWSARYSSNQSRRISGSATIERGGYYGGHRDMARLSLNFLLRDTLLVEPNYTRNVVTAPGQPRYVTNTLNTRVSYSFSPELFVKGFVQYNDDRRLASLNLLLWYVYRPGSDLYIVYNHGWDTDLPGPRRVETRSRSFTVKLTCWLSR